MNSAGSGLHLGVWGLPIVSIVAPFFGLTNSILRILKGNPPKRNYNGDFRWGYLLRACQFSLAIKGAESTQLPMVYP